MKLKYNNIASFECDFGCRRTKKELSKYLSDMAGGWVWGVHRLQCLLHDPAGVAVVCVYIGFHRAGIARCLLSTATVHTGSDSDDGL